MNRSTKYISLALITAGCVMLWMAGYHYTLPNAEAAPSATPAATCNIAVSSAVPHDATIPKAHIGNPTAIQIDFDTLSWNTFIALNWPADSQHNGQPDPDPSKKIGLQDYGPVVWETYKPTYNVFVADDKGNPVAPAAWNTQPSPPPGCDLNGAYAAKLGKPIRVVKNISKDGLNEFLEAFSNAPLIDQKGAFARYEVLVNEQEFNNIVSPVDPSTGKSLPPLYNANNQTNVNFPVGQLGGVEGPIEVKAAWKILGATDDPNRYHTEMIQIAWPNQTTPITYQCSQPIMVGLVALHISHKTFNAPQWAWSTFEQVDNYRPPPGSPFGRKASFFNPDCPAATCPPNQPAPSPAGGWNGDPTANNQAPPTQVVPGKSAKVQTGCNEQAQQLLRGVNPKSVWQYYQLVSTQWPQDPYSKPGQPSVVYDPPTLAHQGANQLPVNLANGAVETYFMGPPESQDTPSCMACHNGAAGLLTNKPLDFSYALQEAYPLTNESLGRLREQRKKIFATALTPKSKAAPSGTPTKKTP